MEGLDKFREAFAQYSDNYVVIGGTACDIIMTNTVVRPRATHDIDMIVVVENMTRAFAERFWQFVREVGYRPEKRKHLEGEPPKYELYRFVRGKDGYPEMIELLSRHPNVLGEPKGLVIEPIPTDDYTSDLSAIIMDDDFYDFTITHSSMTDGIRHANSATLIALKARAYLNLLSDKRRGIHVDWCVEHGTLLEDLIAHGWTKKKTTITPPSFDYLIQNKEVKKLLGGRKAYGKVVIPEKIALPV